MLKRGGDGEADVEISVVMEHSYSRLAVVTTIKSGQKLEGVTKCVTICENHVELHNLDESDKMGCSPETANAVWMDHCYFSFEVDLEKEEGELTREEGALNFTEAAVSGPFRVKEDPDEEMPFACVLEAKVTKAADIWTDHCYIRAIAGSEEESQDLSAVLVKREPVDAGENDCTEGKQLDSASGPFRVKEEPDEAMPLPCGSEAEILTAADVWMDDGYNRAIAETKQESRDVNPIFVKGEPIDADETDCPDGDLLISENAASHVEDALGFAFASCGSPAMPRAVAQLLKEHNYGHQLEAEASALDLVTLAEADPLSLDREPGQICPETEDQSTRTEEPSVDFQARLCAINDDEPNRNRAKRRNVDVKNISTSSEFLVNKYNLPIFQCRLCHESFDSYPDFDCHFTLRHKRSQNDWSYLCDICGSSCGSSQELVAHMNWEHDCQIDASKVLKEPTRNFHSGSKTILFDVKELLRCRACWEEFECETDLKIHLLLNRCKLSSVDGKMAFDGASFLQEHGNATQVHSHSRSYTCRLCNQSFMLPGLLLRHLMLRNCNEMLTCDFCQYAFLTPSSLKAHRNSSECMKRDPSQLLEASRQLTDSVESKLEALTNSKPGCYHCHICLEIFRWYRDLTRHFTSNHIDFIADDFCYRRLEYELKTNQPAAKFSSEVKPNADTENLYSIKKYPEPDSEHSCDICQKTFKNKILLQCHKETHRTRQDVTCVECERCFMLTSNLKKHLKRCHVTKPLRATQPPAVKSPSPKASRLPPIIKTYVRKARKQTLPSLGGSEKLQTCVTPKNLAESQSCAKTFTCDSCQKVVSTKSELRSHLKSHVTERNFGCLECEEYFTYAVDFLQHTKRCSAKFARNNKTPFKVSPVEKRKRKRRSCRKDK